MRVYLLGDISNSRRSNGELGVGFSESRAINDGADTILSAPLAETEASCTSVGNDVATNRFVESFANDIPSGLAAT